MKKNIYIENHDEIAKIGKEYNLTVENAMTAYQTMYGVPHDAKARAQYIAKFAPASLSNDETVLLEVE